MLSAAARIAREDAPGRKKVISERSNFPTDLYIAQSVCQEYGLELVLLEPEEIAAALQPDVAISMLTHVNYRTGAMHDMAAVPLPHTLKAFSASGTCATARAPCLWT